MNMKKITFSLIAVFAIVMLSCRDNAFDFSHLDTIDGEGNWGIPVTAVEYSIEDILNMAENIPIAPGTDGTLQLEYATEVDSIISSNKFLSCLSDREFNLRNSFQVNLPTQTIPSGATFTILQDTMDCEMPGDEVRVEAARIKSGQLAFAFTHNCPANVEVEVVCSQLQTPSGNTFSQTFNNQSGSEQQISLAGYRITPMSVNKLRFRIVIKGIANGSAMPTTANFSYDLSVRHIIFEEMIGRVCSYSTDITKSIDLNLDYIAKTMGGNFTIYNPDIRCEVNNMFPVGAHIVMSQAALVGPGVPSASLIATSPATINVPAATQQFEQVALPISSSLTFNPQMNEARLSANVTVNPEGFNTSGCLVLHENQFIHLRVSFKIPLHVKMDNVTFCDTLDFSQTDFPDIEGISNMAMRCIFENTLPLDLFCQVYFYDEVSHTIRDSLFHNSHLIMGCYGNTPTLYENYITKDNMDELRSLLRCNKIILKAKVDTDGHQVCIRNEQKLRILMGASFNLNLNDLAHYVTD